MTPPTFTWTIFSSKLYQCVFLLLFHIFFWVFLVQCDGLSWQPFSCCAHINTVYHIISLSDAPVNTCDDAICEPVEILLLQHADRRWFALYKDFVYENIAVSHDKEIFIIDYEELSIIENIDFDGPNGLCIINIMHFCAFC